MKLFFHKNPLTRPRTTAKTRPDIQFEISNPFTNCAVSKIIKNPIRAPTNPKVIKLIGKERNLKRAPTVAFTTASTIATIIAVHRPLILTPGVIYAATKTAIPETRRLRRNDITNQ